MMMVIWNLINFSFFCIYVFLCYSHVRNNLWWVWMVERKRSRLFDSSLFTHCRSLFVVYWLKYDHIDVHSCAASRGLIRTATPLCLSKREQLAKTGCSRRLNWSALAEVCITASWTKFSCHLFWNFRELYTKSVQIIATGSFCHNFSNHIY